MIEQAQQVQQTLGARLRRLRPGVPERGRGERLHQAVNHFLPLVEQVVRQARTRVLEGGKGAAQEKMPQPV